MSKMIVALCAMALVSGVAAAEQTTATQAAKMAPRPAMSAEDKAALFKAAYEYAGVSAETIQKLDALEAKRAEAKGDKSKMLEIRKERESLMTADQQSSFSEYFRLHAPWAQKGKDYKKPEQKKADEKKAEDQKPQ